MAPDSTVCQRSLTETQEALGHRHVATTRVYLERVVVKRDRLSSVVSRLLEFDRVQGQHARKRTGPPEKTPAGPF